MMNAKDTVKVVWKSLMKVLIRFYTNNYKMFIYNHRTTLTDKDVLKMFYDEKLAQPGKKLFYSQYAQDAFVLNRVYKGRSFGTFVDIGGNHPTNCNNTYLLELNGWHGIAVEPQASLNTLWREVRKAKCLACVVGPENKEVTFLEGDPAQHGLSGIDGYNKLTGRYKKVVVQQRRLDDILNENGIAEVDYLSVDVEGYELKVLESIDFSKVKIGLIGIENDIGFKHLPVIGKRLGFEIGSNKLRRFLESKGYEQIARIVSDDFFVKVE